MFIEPEKNSLNLITEDDLEEDSLAEQTTEATLDRQSNNPDWDSRLELLRVCSSNGKFVTKKARAPPIGGKWATDEDEHLRDIVRVHGAENWRKVAMLLGPTSLMFSVYIDGIKFFDRVFRRELGVQTKIN